MNLGLEQYALLRRWIATRTGDLSSRMSSEPFFNSVTGHYSVVPATDEVFSLPNSSSTFCQAFGSFFVANGAPVSE